MLFRNMPIVTRLASAFALILVFMVGLGFFSWVAMNDLKEKALHAERVVMPAMEEAQRMTSLVAHSVAALKDYFASSDVDYLSDGLTVFHEAWRTGQNLLKQVELNQDLQTLEVYLVSFNSLYPATLRDIQQAMTAHDEFARVRESTHAEIGLATRAVLDFLHAYARCQRAAGMNAEQEDALDVRMVTLFQQMWMLRENLLRARIGADVAQAQQIKAQWVELLGGIRRQYETARFPNCIPLLQAVEQSAATAERSIQAFIDAWRAELDALERVRISSTLLLDSSQRLNMMGVELMGALINSAARASLQGMDRVLLLTGLAALAGLALATLLGHDITTPLRRCLRFAQSVASGNLAESLTLQRRDEIGLMADAINVMVASLRRRIDELGALEREMRQARAVSERALVMAKAASWHIEPGVENVYLPTPEMSSVVGIALEGMRSCEEWYSWVAAVDKDAMLQLRLGVEGVLNGERNIYDIITPLQAEGMHEPIWVRSLLEAVRDSEGQVIRYLGITQDVTDYMRQQQVLEAATRAQSAFIASMSHEIRNPLNAIIGLGHLLRATEMTPRQRDYLAKSDGAAQLLLGLINDILDLSKIRAGEMRMEGIPFSLHQLLQRIMGMASGLDKAEGLRLDMVLDENVPDLVQGDSLRLQQVLTNLLTNACKFTPQGAVRLLVRVVGRQAPPWPDFLQGSRDVVRLQLTVSDTGIGMTASQKERLFRPFAQADDTIARRYGGTGLGLAICRDLVALMGGEISVVSEVGKGSTFEVTVLCGLLDPDMLGADGLEGVGLAPAAVAGAGDGVPGDAGGTEGRGGARALRVLVAEDDAINGLIVREVLEAAGYAVDVAVNGAEAVEKATTATYAAVLMDLQMPVMDGLRAARCLRAMPQYRSTPILAMTAHAMQGDRERILEAGMDDHITKPFDPAQLCRTLALWLQKRRR